MSGKQEAMGPDLTAGVAPTDVPEGGMLGGHVGDENVLVARRNGKLFALSATCTHYGGPLDKGLIVGGTVRCPWHHARFDLATGQAVGAPALNPVSCWRVDVENGKLFVRERQKLAKRPWNRPRRRIDRLGALSRQKAGVGGAKKSARRPAR